MSGLDPISLQVLTGGLRAACEEMGAVLIRASHSANIKERRDCSTALFDARGEMVMQAEHIPVHLGSMPAAVEAVLDRDHAPGRSWILNDPYRGGTHLPDITLIEPIFTRGLIPERQHLIGFAASRAHHADVGGPTPGSMPADSHTLADEGVVIPPTEATEEALKGLASRMRAPDQRLADLRAQRAANRVGAERLADLAEALGADGLASGLDEILAYAERRTRQAIADLPDGTYRATDVLEDDAVHEHDLTIRVAVTVAGEEMTIDFTGTDPQTAGNLNCPLSVTRSAALFAVRVLTDPDAPPSAGAYRPVTVTAPSGCVLCAEPPAAVAAGNVETSSRVADVVIEALSQVTEAPAQGQGTMNNLTLSGKSAEGGEWTYYETLGGGQGACSESPGDSGVHVAMSNTLNTPVEALEAEFPVRVRGVGIRRGSGGDGASRGGDGIVREIQALEPMRFTLITERRRHAPRGRDGGGDGSPGANAKNGDDLGAKATGDLRPGDVLRIETPGGGAKGNPC